MVGGNRTQAFVAIARRNVSNDECFQFPSVGGGEGEGEASFPGRMMIIIIFFFSRDQVREVPSQLEIFLSKKQYLNATQLLTTTLSLGDGNLAGIEALREVRTELQTKKQILYGKLMEVRFAWKREREKSVFHVL